jgi:hypothetical protein
MFHTVKKVKKKGKNSASLVKHGGLKTRVFFPLLLLVAPNLATRMKCPYLSSTSIDLVCLLMSSRHGT